MDVFEFCDFTEIEAFVLAPEIERAKEIFKLHLLTHGGNPDDYLWRDFQRREVGRAARSAIDDGFSIGREGLIVSNAADRWVFITPVGGDRRGPIVGR